MSNPVPSATSSSLRNRLVRGGIAIALMAGLGLVISLLRSAPAPKVNPDVAEDSSVDLVLPEPTQVSLNFVGSAACTKCHAEIAKRYQAHPMAQSLAAVEKASVKEPRDHTEFSPIPELTYRVEFRDQQQFHHEIREDAAGEVIYDQAVPVHFAVGSGQRGRTYLTNQGGRLCESMISWFHEGNIWALSPGYQPEMNERFERQASDGCLTCHSGRMNRHPTDLNRFDERNPFLEEAIGCERCHGPGGDHVALREKGNLPPGASDPIVNPIHFTDDRRDATCNQCHLQGRRRVLKYGRSEFDFRPGMYLSEIWTTFVKTEGVATGQAAAVSQVEQMHASQCFQKSGGKLSCIDCHDPHGLPDESERIGYFRSRCLTCHGSGQTECSEKADLRTAAQDSCIQCHMPSFPAKDVHAAQTEHRILRRPAEPALELTPPLAANDINVFQEKGYLSSPVEKNRARGIYQAGRAYANRDQSMATEAIQLLAPIADQNSQDEETYYAMGQAFSVLQQTQLAAKAWEQVLKIRPTHEEAIDSMAIMFHEAKDLNQARKYYSMAVGVNPTRSMYYGRLAHVLGQMGDFNNAKVAVLKSLELNPSLSQAHAWLAEVYQRENNLQEAERHYKLAERLQFQSTNTEK